MSDEIALRVALPGNPGNMMFMYMSALRLRHEIGTGKIANVAIKMFGIDIPDIDTAGKNGLHFRQSLEDETNGRVPFEAAKALLRRQPPDFIQFEGYCQHVDNLVPRDQIDYASIFPHPNLPADGGRDDELVISIRGGEILKAVPHPHYVQIPIEFYADIIAATGLRPVFFGQLGENSYCDALRRRFPTATFRAGTSPEADFDYMRRSKNLVPSISSFAWLAAWLSDAQQIFLPISGLFHPAQHRGSFFLPLDDPRFRFFLFPFNYWIDVDSFPIVETALHRRWEAISARRLQSIFSAGPANPRDLHQHIGFVDPEFYVAQHPEIAQVRERHGDCAVFNHYIEQGFANGTPPLQLDKAWYCRTYPDAASALGRREYADEYHHYVAAGAALGYRPRPLD